MTPSTRRFCVAFGMLAATLFGAFACADANAEQGADRPSAYAIVVTTGMLGDIAAAVAADRASVTVLMGPGTDPHLYRPTRSDVQRLMRADVILYHGHMLEGRMTDALTRAQRAGRRVLAVSEQLDEALLLEGDDDDEPFDPHLWMDPRLWSKAIAIVRDELSAHDPEGAAIYAANAEAYAAELARLDAYAERVLATVPEGSRVLITAHDAFAYFGRRYGFEVLGIQGISTESEAGVRDIERLVSLLVEQRIGAVFTESTVSDRAVGALIAGARARGHEVRLGGELFSDAMGNAGTYEGTYIGMIDHNVTTIARALGGNAPERGMQNKLKK